MWFGEQTDLQCEVTEWPGSDVQHMLDPDHPLIVQTQTLRVIIKPQTLKTGIPVRVCGAQDTETIIYKKQADLCDALNRTLVVYRYNQGYYS